MAADTKTPSSLPRRGIVDVFIVLVILLFALDTLPCTPPSVRRCMEPLLDVTGLWQGTWTLFAPVPDRQNHRLRAEIEFVDGTKHIWNSPDWPTQTAWQRFTGHRESEFIEKIWEDDNSAAWPAFAKSLVVEHQRQVPSATVPRRATLSVIWGEISPPEGTTWKPIANRTPLDHERIFFTLIYPEQ